MTQLRKVTDEQIRAAARRHTKVRPMARDLGVSVNRLRVHMRRLGVSVSKRQLNDEQRELVERLYAEYPGQRLGGMAWKSSPRTWTTLRGMRIDVEDLIAECWLYVVKGSLSYRGRVSFGSYSGHACRSALDRMFKAETVDRRVPRGERCGLQGVRCRGADPCVLAMAREIGIEEF